MNITDEQKEKILKAIEDRLFDQVVRQTVDRIIEENQDRIQKHIAEVAGKLSEEIKKEFPL